MFILPDYEVFVKSCVLNVCSSAQISRGDGRSGLMRLIPKIFYMSRSFLYSIVPVILVHGCEELGLYSLWSREFLLSVNICLEPTVAFLHREGHIR